MRAPGTEASGPVAAILTWFWRLATLTGTWWLQTIAGGVLLGFGPATLVLTRRLRAELEPDDADAAHPWRLWRTSFWDAQVRIGLPLLTVIVLAWYLLALRDTPWAISVAVLGAAYLLWLLPLPAVAITTEVPEPATTSWYRTAVLIARVPLPFLIASLATAVVVVAVLLAYPGALVLVVPAGPALAGVLAVRAAGRVLGSREEPSAQGRQR